MTKEEAIKLIDDRMCFGRGKWSKHHMPERDVYWIAGEMAIKALEQPEPCDKCTETHACDTISRQAAIEWCLEGLNNMPSAQSEIIRCRDCKYSDENWRRVSVKWLPCMDIRVPSNCFCGSAERLEDDE